MLLGVGMKSNRSRQFNQVPPASVSSGELPAGYAAVGEALGLDELQPVGEAAGEPAHPVAHSVGVDAVAAGRERLA